MSNHILYGELPIKSVTHNSTTKYIALGPISRIPDRGTIKYLEYTGQYIELDSDNTQVTQDRDDAFKNPTKGFDFYLFSAETALYNYLDLIGVDKASTLSVFPRVTAQDNLIDSSNPVLYLIGNDSITDAEATALTIPQWGSLWLGPSHDDESDRPFTLPGTRNPFEAGKTRYNTYALAVFTADPTVNYLQYRISIETE